MKLNVLIACEYSQIIATEFINLGHNAFSCDIVPTTGFYPWRHIIGDARHYLSYDWDLLIAHPPCPYLTALSAPHLYPKKEVNCYRLKKGLEAKEFFMEFYNAPIKFKCIENPRPLKIWNLPMHSQIIQPYQFGDPFSKMTYLWTQNLRPLVHTNVLTEHTPWIHSGKNNYYLRTQSVENNNSGKKNSQSFKGIAKAMAEQYSSMILNF
jgi:hypothetical protein